MLHELRAQNINHVAYKIKLWKINFHTFVYVRDTVLTW
jgi:hypothetical protein